MAMPARMRADEAESWVGRLVVGKKAASTITFGDNATGKQEYFEFQGGFPVKVLADRDGWLRLHDGVREGWAGKSAFLPGRSAVRFWTDRIRSNDGEGFSWACRAAAWEACGENENAIKDYTEAIRLQPEVCAYFVNRGRLHRLKGDGDKALGDMSEAIRIDPNNDMAWGNRGSVYSDLKEYDKSMADNSEAIRLNPKLGEHFSNRGICWYRVGRHDKAMQDFNEAIRLNPRLVNPFGYRGNIMLERKEYDKALADYDACVRLEPTNADAAASRGEVFAARKEYALAVKAYDDALKLNDRTYAPWYHAEFLASCPDATFRDGNRALALAKKALEIDGKNVRWEVQAAVAAAYAETGDFESALVFQRTALADKACTGNERKKQELRLKLYTEKQPYRAE